MATPAEFLHFPNLPAEIRLQIVSKDSRGPNLKETVPKSTGVKRPFTVL